MIEHITMTETETQAKEQSEGREYVEACFPALHGALALECFFRDPKQVLLNFHQYYI